MSETRVGVLIDETAERDAIHIAVCPCIAGVQMRAGRHVGVKEGVASPLFEHIGIVDPFLKSDVEKDQHFYVFLYPGSITSLRHQWTHPAFNKVVISEDVQGESIAWLRQFAIRSDKSYTELLRIGEKAIKERYGQYVGDDNDSDLFNENKHLFVKHVALVLGLMPPDDVDTYYFSCAC